MDVIRVAVTGVGGGCGQGIMKALFASGLNVEVYPVDITPYSAGLYRGRAGGTVLPKPEDDIEAWEAWAVENRIRAILPGSDHDLMPLAKVRETWWDKHKMSVLVSSPELVEIANDKWLTWLTLHEAGVDAPNSFLSPDVHGLSYPLVVKPTFGMTSRGVHVCQDETEMRFHFEHTPGAFLQEYLPGDEYTCAVFNTKWDGALVFIARRDLYAGTTYRAEIVSPERVPEIASYLKQLARVLQPRGAMNVQLKMVPGRGPVAFEINARCSGSTAMRAASGYNEPGMMLKHYVMGERVFQPKYKPGYFFRFWEEMYLEGADAACIADVTSTKASGLKGKVASWL